MVCGPQTLETALGYRLDNQKVWVLFLADAPMFHFTTTFRLGLGPTQCPIKWITGALCTLVQHMGFDFKQSAANTAKCYEPLEISIYIPNGL